MTYQQIEKALDGFMFDEIVYTDTPKRKSDRKVIKSYRYDGQEILVSERGNSSDFVSIFTQRLGADGKPLYTCPKHVLTVPTDMIKDFDVNLFDVYVTIHGDITVSAPVRLNVKAGTTDPRLI